MSTQTQPTGAAPNAAVTNNTALPNLSGESFNIEQFAVSTQVDEFAGGRKLLTMIPVRKPAKENWVRTYPEVKGWWFVTHLLDLKEYNETYLLVPDVLAYLRDIGENMVSKQVLIPTITRQGTLFLWPIRLPAEDGSNNSWNESAMDAADRARKTWVRLKSDRSLGGYCVVAREGGEDPQWPDLSMPAMLEIAFKGRIIKSLDHPRLAELLGHDSTARMADPVAALVQQELAAKE